MNFILALNESTVTYIRDIAALGYAVTTEGVTESAWEAISPYGEIKCFFTYAHANAWRMEEVREYALNY